MNVTVNTEDLYLMLYPCFHKVFEAIWKLQLGESLLVLGLSSKEVLRSSLKTYFYWDPGFVH